MKRVSFNSLQSSPEEARIRQRHQILLQDYLELQKEFVSKKRKLQTSKWKRDALLAEVRFLRQRKGYLLNMQSSKTETENVQRHNSHVKQPAEISVNEAVQSSQTRVSEMKTILDSIEEKGTKKEAIRLHKKPKNCLINGKRVGKKKISVQDRVVLEV